MTKKEALMTSELGNQITKTLSGMGINSLNRLEKMLHLVAFHDDEVFWRVFNQNWSGCDDTWTLQDDVVETLEFRSADGRYLTEEEAAFLGAFGPSFTVYRGCSRQRIRGLSWTTDIEIAKSFLDGHRSISVPEPVLVRAKIRPSEVFAVILDRDESEIVLNPRCLRYVREINRLG